MFLVHGAVVSQVWLKVLERFGQASHPSAESPLLFSLRSELRLLLRLPRLLARDARDARDAPEDCDACDARDSDRRLAGWRLDGSALGVCPGSAFGCGSCSCATILPSSNWNSHGARNNKSRITTHYTIWKYVGFQCEHDIARCFKHSCRHEIQYLWRLLCFAFYWLARDCLLSLGRIKSSIKRILRRQPWYALFIP